MKYICVFCGTSDKGAEKYAEITAELGRLIVANGYGLICGGANAGLMNVITDAVLAAKGEVIGITTTEIQQASVVHTGLQQLIVEKDLATRKEKMLQMSDAFITLPGGLGSLDEMTDIAVNNQFAHFGARVMKPLALLNVDGFYDGLLMQLDRCCKDNFMTPEHRGMIYSHEDPQAVIKHIANYQSPAPSDVRWWEKEKLEERLTPRFA